MDKLHEESRKQFEEWAASQMFSLSKLNGSYAFIATAAAWRGWVASRNSIVVDLPTEHDLRQVVCSECASESLELVESRIRSIGLSIKGEVV